MKMSAADWGIIMLLSLLWGGAFFMIELGLRGFPPNTLVFLRMALAVPPMLLALRLMGLKMPTDAKSWRQLFVLGAINAALPFILFFWGQTKIESGLASILNATTPLWGVVTAHFLTRDEKATPARIVGVLLGLAGIIVMVGTDALGGISGSVLAQLACLLATLLYALAAVYGRTLSQSTMTPLVVATGQVVTAAIFMLPVMLVVDAPWTLSNPGWDAWAGAIGLAIPSTAIAYFFYFRLIDSAGASNAMLVAFIMPVIAVILGVVALGETVETKELAGAALIALGLLAIDGRLLPKSSAASFE
ncbi:MAG TPA: DMT family transporter [Sphingorhabdus sp.]|nr:DMT family transporter [Sphingorhabdus sp.]